MERRVRRRVRTGRRVRGRRWREKEGREVRAEGRGTEGVRKEKYLRAAGPSSRPHFTWGRIGGMRMRQVNEGHRGIIELERS